MNWKTMATAALLVGLAAPVAAQQGPREMRGGGMQGQRGGEGIQQILQLRETLELSEDQVVRLESLESDFSEQREAHRAQAEEFRTRVRSGDLSRNEIEEWRTNRRESMENIRQAHRQMVEQLLTEDQRGKLAEIGQVRRGGMRDGARAGFRAGQRMGQGHPGGGPGMRGNRGIRNRPGLRGGRGPGRRGPGGR